MNEFRRRGKFAPDPHRADVARALIRFRSKCQFEPETGCVIWTGGKTQGRGHHVPYGSFWYDGARWFAHRWAAKFILGLDIDGFDVDHCCPGIPTPNTLCVAHLAAETPARNRELQTMRTMIHLQVGLVQYEDIYGAAADRDPDLIPFYSPPAWLTQGPNNERSPDRSHDTLRRVSGDRDDCPF